MEDLNMASQRLWQAHWVVRRKCDELVRYRDDHGDVMRSGQAHVTLDLLSFQFGLADLRLYEGGPHDPSASVQEQVAVRTALGNRVLVLELRLCISDERRATRIRLADCREEGPCESRD